MTLCRCGGWTSLEFAARRRHEDMGWWDGWGCYRVGGLCLKACRSGGRVMGGGGVDFHLGGVVGGVKGEGLKMLRFYCVY